MTQNDEASDIYNEHPDDDEPFITRHIGIAPDEVQIMLGALGYQNLEEFISTVVPEHIRLRQPLDLPESSAEHRALSDLRKVALENKPTKSLIGQGFYNTVTPAVILRNVFESPGWYTAYTPYQPEVSQGRLESLLNFQTMIVEMTGMDVANASLLDEASAAAEAMLLMHRASKKSTRKRLLMSDNLFQTTKAVLRTRAEPLDIEIVEADWTQDLPPGGEEEFFGMIVQYPGKNGNIVSLEQLVKDAKQRNIMVAVATDLSALCMLKPPGSFDVDVCFGSSQRFGVPLGFGGPHAAFFAVKDAYIRQLPGRLIGVSIDSAGNKAYRMTLQTREQHIRRDKATSNICTAQALLANMAAFFAIYHGENGLMRINSRIHMMTRQLYHAFCAENYPVNASFFDTLTVHAEGNIDLWHDRAVSKGFNLRRIDNKRIGISLDETITQDDLHVLTKIFELKNLPTPDQIPAGGGIPENLKRQGGILTSDVFHQHRSETAMMRYLRRLKDKDVSLDRSMIPLGSCTMKLNSASEMIPLSWSEFSDIHPYAPASQSEGYTRMIKNLESYLCAITGFDAINFQPNSGSQGEYSGLMAVRGYLQKIGQGHRNICLIPISAHGTNAASAVLAGMTVVAVACEDNGDISIADLQEKVLQHSDNLAVFMVTYPSTHGVFESSIKDLCQIIHDHGAQVYMDGANMNAQLGLSRPGDIGADVAHLNLHKTFCIPHGGGGPGIGPVCVKSHLSAFLPGHAFLNRKDGAVTAAPYGSAGILAISYMFIRLMGGNGLKYSAQIAILTANYIALRLRASYPTLYRGETGLVAHEAILDLRHFQASSGVMVEDIAKRLIDYGFHAPTMSFPVANTFMVEPTESESLREVERFIEAMLTIRQEIADIENGKYDQENNLLKHAPFTANELVGEWKYPFSRQEAVFPLPYLCQDKYWVPVKRIDNVYGDRNLMCTCPPLEL